MQYHRERISFVFSDQYIASNILFVVVLVFDSHDSCFFVFFFMVNSECCQLVEG